MSDPAALQAGVLSPSQAPAPQSPRLARRVLRRPRAVVALGWLALLAAAVLAADLLAPYGPLENDLGQVLSGPTGDHPLGTDTLGRDVLSRVLHGGRVTLLGAAEAVGVYLVIGVTLGLAAGYLGGWVEWLVTRAADLLFAVPGIVIVLVVLSVFTNNVHAAMVTFGLLGTPGIIRILRAQTLSLREELYVAAARVSGLSSRQILWRHILPRTAGTIIVQTALFAAIALVIESGLGFLGFGAQPPDPSWGNLVKDASEVIDRQRWLLVPSGVPLVLTIIALGVLGDAVRDAAAESWSVSKLAKAGPGAAVPAGAAGGADEPDPGALLSVRDLTIEIGGAAVVQEVSFDVRAGETLGIVGESGCGKSVTALGVLGLVPGGGHVAGGRIHFGGRDTTGRMAGLRGTGIAYVSQEPMVALDPTFTVGAQLAEAVRKHRGASRAEAKARAVKLLGMVGLPAPERVARRYPHQMSGGMAQRAAIALALAGEPELLIADEPTTALDVTVQAEILALLRGLQEETGMAILIVTHDWGVVADLCHRSVVMYAGQVAETAEVTAMFRQPFHPYTEGLMAANPQLAAEGGELPAIPGTVPAPADWPRGCRFAARCAYATPECSAAPVALDEPAAGRLSRCLHTDLLVTKGGPR